MNAAARTRRQSRRDLTVLQLLPYATYSPPIPSSALGLLHRAAGPPRLKLVIGWVRGSAHASTLARLSHAFLKASDVLVIEDLLRSGQHDQATTRFCECFSVRHFPLEYASAGRGELLVELTSGIQHEGYGDNWEELGDLWSLKPVFLLAWALMEDPYPVDYELIEDVHSGDESASAYRPCHEARDAIAQVAELPVQELFAGLPPGGFPADHLRSRFTGTCWEPLLWAAPWLWRASGNRFLDRDDDDYFAEPEPWSVSAVFALTSQHREAVRIMRAVAGFNDWVLHAPAERARAAVQAARGPRSNRISTLLDLPTAGRHDVCSCPPVVLTL